MNDYKLSLWVSNIVTLLIAVCLAVSIKIVFNPILLQQQELSGKNLQLALLPNILDLTQLNSVIQQDQFTYIKVINDELSSPIIVTKNSEHDIFNNLFPISVSTLHSTTSNQVFEYTIENDKLYALYRSIILILIIGIIIVMLISNLIYFKLFRKIEASIVDEITNDDHTVTPFVKVSAELHEQKRLFHRALQTQEKKIMQLAKQVNMDNLTGLNNRYAFRKELTEFLSNENSQQHAILAIIRLFELAEMNVRRGFQQGDDYVVNVANMLNKVIERYDHIHVSRISGSDFALIAHTMSIVEAQQLAKELKAKFDEYQLLNGLDNVAFTGMTSIISNQLPEKVLARADIALAKAQTKGINAWAFEQNDSEGDQLGQAHWRSIIELVIKNRSAMLLHQPIQAIHRNMHGYEEVFTRFIGENHNIIPTDTVFAMAQRTDQIVKLEQLIIEKIVAQCRTMNDHTTRWGLNISSSAVQCNSFIVWLERLLLREPNIAAVLIFEMQEKLLDSNLTASKRMFNMLKRTGSRSAICNFGKGIGSFRLFKELKPDFVKIDATLITGIERDSANQQFVRMIIDVAHRMDCHVIAEGIEHLEQKQTLENMYIDGVQGFLIAKPEPL